MDYPICNFRWRLAGLIATGQKLTESDQVHYLIEQGFKAIVSLVEIPDAIINQIKSSGIDYLFFDLDEWTDSDGFRVQEVPRQDYDLFADFISRHLSQNNPIYVHCSHGNLRSPSMVERLMRRRRREQKANLS